MVSVQGGGCRFIKVLSKKAFAGGNSDSGEKLVDQWLICKGKKKK